MPKAEVQNGDIEVVLRSLRANNFDARFAERSEQATKIIFEMISRDMSIGIGDSATIREIGVLDLLHRDGFKVTNPFVQELTVGKGKAPMFDEACRRALICDIFLTGTNAVTLDGKLVNIDANGNRVAGMIFGPRKVIIVAGRNKVVRDVDEALYRIKNTIAPYHTRKKEINTPCAVKGICIDCNAERRICNITTIIEKKPRRTDMSIILIDEDLGLGWDPSWPQDRVGKIRSSYDEVTWVFTGLREQSA